MQAVPDHCFPIPQVTQALDAVLPAGDMELAAQEAQTLVSVNVLDGAPARAYLPSGQVKDKQAVPPVE